MKTLINPEMALGADGPAFYNARDGVEKLKLSEKKKTQPQRDCFVVMDVGEEVQPACNQMSLVNATLSTLYYIESGWSDKQREIIKRLSFDKDDNSQNEIGKELGITQSSVQRRLQASGYYTYRYAMDEVQLVFNELWEVMNV